MSSWDAPTGSWGSGDEPGADGPDEQEDQHGQPTGGYRALPGGGGRVRAGQRGLSGYEQAQSDDAFRSYGQAAGYGRPGYGESAGYGQAAGYGRPGYGESAGYGQAAGYGQPGYGEPADYGRPGYGEPVGYGRPGYGEPASYGESGYGSSPGGPEPSGYDPGSATGPQPRFIPAPDPGSAFRSGPGGDARFGSGPDRGPDPLASGPDNTAGPGYGEAGPGLAWPGGEPAGYGQDGQDGYGQDGYGQDGYDGYGQDGLQAPVAPGFDDDLPPQDRPARSGRSRAGRRSAQRPGGIKMALYLAASVVGVVVIAYLVVHLAKGGTAGSAAGGTATPGPAGGAAAAGQGLGYKLVQAAAVGSYPLNKPATTQYGSVAVRDVAPAVDQIASARAGVPGRHVVGLYDLGPVSSVSSPDFKAIRFVGYDGSFDPRAVIKLEKSRLASPRTVNAGPHGGDMICGYDVRAAGDASTCVWVTKTTFGQVDFIVGQALAKYPGAATLALDVRNAVEVPVSS